MADNAGQAPAAAPQPVRSDSKSGAAPKDSAKENSGPSATATVVLPPAEKPKPRAPRARGPKATAGVNRGGRHGILRASLLGIVVVLMLAVAAGVFFSDYRFWSFGPGSSVVTNGPLPPVASIPPAPAQPTNLLCDNTCRIQMVSAQCGPHHKVQFERWPWGFEEFRQTLDKVCPKALPPAPAAPVKVKAAPPPAPQPAARVVADPCAGGRCANPHIADSGKLIPDSQADIFRWKNVGGDPCNPKAGCTLQWALAQSQWPSEVQQGLIQAVRTFKPEEITISSGWRGWMTWGKYTPRFHPNTLADWPSGQTEPAYRWSVTFEGLQYNLIKVHKCGNWGGYTSPPAYTNYKPPGIPPVACP